MTKQSYLEMLQEKLENFGQELQEEILEDYRQHFAEGEKEGKSDEEIIEELGNIEDMIQDLSQTNPQETFREKEQRDNKRTKIGIELEIDKDVKRIDMERKYDYPGNYQEAVLSGEVADVIITPSNDDQIHICCRRKGNIVDQMAYEYYQYEENGIFYAGVRKKKNWEGNKKKVTVFGHTIFAYGDMSSFCKGEPKLELEVEIPAGISALQVSTSSGDGRISGLRLEALQTSTASGDFRISGVESAEMMMNTASGDIDINGGSANRWKLNTASGDITARNITLDAGHINAASGDIKIQDGQVNRLKCNSASGDIMIASVAKVCECSAASGDITIKCRGTQEKLAMGTASGDIKLQLDGSEGIEARVKTNCGDIDIAWNGERHSVKKGTFIYGNGACKASLSTGSGDITIIGNQ